MQFTQVVTSRRMVRHYADRAVPEHLVEDLLEAAIRAPSAGFSQGWDFLVLQSAADRDLFWQVTTDPQAPADSWLRGMRTAPLLIVCLSHAEAYLDRYAEPDKGWTDRAESRWPVPYWHVDTGMAALLMLLSAVDHGLGGCFFGVPAHRLDAFRTAFEVPGSRSPVGVVSIGYPAPERRSRSLRRGRRPVAEVAHRGRFGVPFTPDPPERPADRRGARLEDRPGARPEGPSAGR